MNFLRRPAAGMDRKLPVGRARITLANRTMNLLKPLPWPEVAPRPMPRQAGGVMVAWLAHPGVLGPWDAAPMRSRRKQSIA